MENFCWAFILGRVCKILIYVNFAKYNWNVINPNLSSYYAKLPKLSKCALHESLWSFRYIDDISFTMVSNNPGCLVEALSTSQTW